MENILAIILPFVESDSIAVIHPVTDRDWEIARLFSNCIKIFNSEEDNKKFNREHKFTPKFTKTVSIFRCLLQVCPNAKFIDCDFSNRLEFRRIMKDLIYGLKGWDIHA